MSPVTVDSAHHMNLMSGTIVREVDFGTTWTLYFRLDEAGAPAQGDYDLAVEVPRLVYEILEIARDRRWAVLAAPRLGPRLAVGVMAARLGVNGAMSTRQR